MSFQMTTCANCGHGYGEHPQDENGTYTGCEYEDCTCKCFEDI